MDQHGFFYLPCFYWLCMNEPRTRTDAVCCRLRSADADPRIRGLIRGLLEPCSPVAMHVFECLTSTRLYNDLARWFMWPWSH